MEKTLNPLWDEAGKKFNEGQWNDSSDKCIYPTCLVSYIQPSQTMRIWKERTGDCAMLSSYLHINNMIQTPTNTMHVQTITINKYLKTSLNHISLKDIFAYWCVCDGLNKNGLLQPGLPCPVSI